jgi:alkanesulfonate monooxygenase SsuD/methylene tetrahydromethanopterin reductase-like flavin-dependent oxidoreductase (luciferase family)
MEFGVLFTSHPNPKEEPYPHRDVHARTTDEVIEAERLGYDTAWIAEHHFATSYGIMPDCFAYMAYLAAKTSRIKIGAAVITLPLYDPIRVVENTSFVDILSNGRVRLGVGSGYRPYEFEGLGKDFDNRRDIVEESIGLMFDAWHRHRWDHKGKYYKGTVKEPYEMLPHPIQMPHPPLYMAGGTDRSIGYSGRNGFGLMLSTLPGVETLAAQTALYKRELANGHAGAAQEPGRGRDRHRPLGLHRRHRPTGARRDRGGDRASHLAFRRLGHGRLPRLGLGEGQRDQVRRPRLDPAARLGRDRDRPPARDAGAHRHDLAAAALSALLRAREDDEEPETVRRARDPGLPSAGAAGAAE